METATLEKKIEQLPRDLKLKVEGYVDALLAVIKEDTDTAPELKQDDNKPKPVLEVVKACLVKWPRILTSLLNILRNICNNEIIA